MTPLLGLHTFSRPWTRATPPDRTGGRDQVVRTGPAGIDRIEVNRSRIPSPEAPSRHELAAAPKAWNAAVSHGGSPPDSGRHAPWVGGFGPTALAPEGQYLLIPSAECRWHWRPESALGRLPLTRCSSHEPLPRGPAWCCGSEPHLALNQRRDPPCLAVKVIGGLNPKARGFRCWLWFRSPERGPRRPFIPPLAPWVASGSYKPSDLPWWISCAPIR